jgi:hypothetical protein
MSAPGGISFSAFLKLLLPNMLSDANVNAVWQKPKWNEKRAQNEMKCKYFIVK